MTNLARKVLQDADQLNASAVMKANAQEEKSDVLSYKKQDLVNAATAGTSSSTSTSVTSPPPARISSTGTGGVGKQHLKVVQRVATPEEDYDSIVDEDFDIESARGVEKKPQVQKQQHEAKEQPPAAMEVADEDVVDSVPAVAAAASSVATAQPWWDEIKQEWSYEAPPTDYVPVYYDPNQTYGTADTTAATAALVSEQVTDDIPDETSTVVPTKATSGAVTAAAPAKVERVADDGDDDDYGEDGFD